MVIIHRVKKGFAEVFIHIRINRNWGIEAKYQLEFNLGEQEEQLLEPLPIDDEDLEPVDLPGVEGLNIGKLAEELLMSLTPSDLMPRPLSVLSISKNKGRLLTPEEGCGFSKAANTKIIGGHSAKIGTSQTN